MDAVAEPGTPVPSTPDSRRPERNRFGFPRGVRLVSNEYRQVFARNTRVAGRYWVIWFARIEGATGGARFGLIASRRTFHLAVARNRARRCMRETFRLNRHCLIDGVWLVLIARAAARHVSRGELDREFCRLCKRAGIWKIPA